MGWLASFALIVASAARAETGFPDTGDTDTDTDTDSDTDADTDSDTDSDTDADPPTETSETGIPDPALDLDDDGDGYTPNQGDCDDAEVLARPGSAEVCSDRIDNNCDGLFDEGCDDAVRLATVRGGGGCTSGTGVAGTQGALLLLPFSLLVMVGWRRR